MCSGGMMPGDETASDVFGAERGGPATLKGPSGSLERFRDVGVPATSSRSNQQALQNAPEWFSHNTAAAASSVVSEPLGLLMSPGMAPREYTTG